MSSPEIPDRWERPEDDAPQDVPMEERLDPSEIDLTGAKPQLDDLIDVIGDAITEALAHGGEVPHWGARTIARLLADIHPESIALHHFAATAKAEFEAMARELAEVWKDERLPDQYRNYINWLGTYIVAKQRELRGPDTDIEVPRYGEAIQAAIAELGPPLEAFLRLRDVTEANALGLFHEAYYGAYDSLDEIAQEVGETHEVWRLLEDASLSHLASPDPKLLLALARQRWDIVAFQGRFYLFEK